MWGLACLACGACVQPASKPPKNASIELYKPRISAVGTTTPPARASPEMLAAKVLAKELLVDKNLIFDVKWYNHYYQVITPIEDQDEEIYDNLLIGSTLMNSDRIQKAIDEINKRS